MSRLYTVDNLIDEVRSMLDEQNTDTIDDTTDILPSLNRAYRKAWEVMADSYPEPLLQLTTGVSVTTREYTIPENLFEDKVKRVEWERNGYVYKCDRVNFNELYQFESNQSTEYPRQYAIYGRTLRFPNIPTGNYTMRLWTLTEPERLVKQDGRITRVDTVGSDNYLAITEVNEDFSPSASDINSYINVVDGQTGVYKATYQVKSYSSGRVILRGTPDRSSVLNRTVSTATTSIDVDDYICHIKGSCVPLMFDPAYVFMIQYSLAELKRNKLGMPYDVDATLVKEFEKDLKDTFMGRQPAARIQHTSPYWKSSRRFFRRRGY